MKPIRINNYCFDRLHLWVQNHWGIPQFVEVVVEIFYPENRRANGLVMFNHGFLIGTDLFYLPKKVIGSFFDDNPLFGVNPSNYYNYSKAIVENNWAMAFVSASHAQFEGVPWTDIGGNPRVGQQAYAAASYLVRYGLTDEFFKVEPEGRNCRNFDADLADRSKFLVSNNVIFAGHSVGGAHAQAAACGFDQLVEIGRSQCRPFDPVMYDREVLPSFSAPMSEWHESQRANPVGLLMLSPVDQKMWMLIPGMERYREALSKRKMPMAMIVGECDCACLDQSAPPAWSDHAADVTQFTQLSPASTGSWAVVANIARGTHCGYLTEQSDLCSMADIKLECKRTPAGPDKKKYQSGGAESDFTTSALRQFIGMYDGTAPFPEDFDAWVGSDFMTWLNRESPDGRVKLVKLPDGRYVDWNPPV